MAYEIIPDLSNSSIERMLQRTRGPETRLVSVDGSRVRFYPAEAITSGYLTAPDQTTVAGVWEGYNDIHSRRMRAK